MNTSAFAARGTLGRLAAGLAAGVPAALAGPVALIATLALVAPACSTKGERDPDPGGVIEAEDSAVLDDGMETKIKLTSGDLRAKLSIPAAAAKAGTKIKARLVSGVMKHGAVAAAGNRVVQLLPASLMLTKPGTLVMSLSPPPAGMIYRAIHAKESDDAWTVGAPATLVDVSLLNAELDADLDAGVDGGASADGGASTDAAYSIVVSGPGLWGIAAGMPDPCPAPNGTTVNHTKDVTADETWAGDGSAHVITTDFTVRPGATLTIEACAVVTVGPGLTVTVAGDATMNKPAKLVTAGTVGRPVTVSRKDPARNWAQVRALGTASLLDFSYTTFDGGGDSAAPMIHLQGANDPLVVNPMLRAVSLTLNGAGSRALWLESGAAFTADSTALTVTGGGPAANSSSAGDLQLTPRAINTMPPAVDIHGNMQNLIRVADGLLQIQRDVRMRNFGVPYYFYFDRVRVHSKTATPKLTIEAGVQLQFDDYLLIGATATPPEPGILDVLGTADNPVVFTSYKATHAAGDWPGLWLSVADGSTIAGARIEAAGGFNGISSANCKPSGSGDGAALLLGGLTGSMYIPSAGDFSNVSIVNSSGHGINAMWIAPEFGPDVTAGFTFTGIVGCKQTKNSRPTGCGTEAGCLVP